jgi:hypothetical protein
MFDADRPAIPGPPSCRVRDVEAVPTKSAASELCVMLEGSGYNSTVTGAAAETYEACCSPPGLVAFTKR